jgi:hypothetical protein
LFPQKLKNKDKSKKKGGKGNKQSSKSGARGSGRGFGRYVQQDHDADRKRSSATGGDEIDEMARVSTEEKEGGGDNDEQEGDDRDNDDQNDGRAEYIINYQSDDIADRATCMLSAAV